MDWLTLNRLGQIRYEEIAANAGRGHSAPGLSNRFGRVLVALGIKLMTPSGCQTLSTVDGYTVQVCRA